VTTMLVFDQIAFVSATRRVQMLLVGGRATTILLILARAWRIISFCTMAAVFYFQNVASY